MRYIGSKKKLTDWINERVSAYAGKRDKSKIVLLDGCAGTGVVSRYFAAKGYQVISNDIMEFSSWVVTGSTGLSQQQIAQAKELLPVMNDLPGIEGFFSKNYSTTAGRPFFTDENAQRIDAMRAFIDTQPDLLIRAYLMYALIEGTSRVMSSTGVQIAFLKKFKSNSLNTVDVRPEVAITAPLPVKTYSMDILKLLQDQTRPQEEILYLDPPYNNRQYGPNYHLYETLVKNDEPELFGKPGIRNWKEETKSDFCSKVGCADFLKKVVTSSPAKLILVSYNTEGMLPEEQMGEILKEAFPNAQHNVYRKPHARFKSDTPSQKRKLRSGDLYELLFEVVR